MDPLERTFGSNEAKKIRESEVSAGEVMQETAHNFYNVLKNVGKAIYYAAHVWPGFSFLIPSTMRSVNEKRSASDIDNFYGILISNCATFFVGFPLYNANYVTAKDIAIYLGGMSATNLISGAYELIRYSKNKVRERKSDGLEEKIK